MDIYKADRLESLKDFAESTSQLGVVERNPPFDAEIFFKNLMTRPFEVVGKIRKEHAILDIKDLMKNIIYDNLNRLHIYFLRHLLNLENHKSLQFVNKHKCESEV